MFSWITVKVRTWIKNYIPYVCMKMIIFPCPKLCVGLVNLCLQRGHRGVYQYVIDYGFNQTLMWEHSWYDLSWHDQAVLIQPIKFHQFGHEISMELHLWLYFSSCETDHSKILHIPRQHSCLGMCKISLWSYQCSSKDSNDFTEYGMTAPC